MVNMNLLAAGSQYFLRIVTVAFGYDGRRKKGKGTEGHEDGSGRASHGGHGGHGGGFSCLTFDRERWIRSVETSDSHGHEDKDDQGGTGHGLRPPEVGKEPIQKSSGTYAASVRDISICMVPIL